MNKSVRFLRYSITLLTFLMISGCSKSNTQSVFVRPVEAVGAEDDGVYVYSFNSTNCSAGDYTEEAIANSLETYTKQSGETDENKQSSQSDISYQTIINAINGQISGKYNDGYITDDIEAKVDLTSIREGYVELGYLLDDIDNDDVYDLIVGVNPTEKFSGWAGSIYKIYTTIAGEVVQVASGDYRHCFYWCEDGTIAQESYDDGFSNGYMFYSLRSGKLELIETVVRQEKETAEGGKIEFWLYSDSLTYEFHDDIERYESITESKAKEILAKYKYKYPSFNAFDGLVKK